MMLCTDRNRLLDSPELLLDWLKQEDPQELERLWQAADCVRRECVGEEVQLRALIEISNYCVRRCAYCGIRGPNSQLARYRMTLEEIVQTAEEAHDLGVRTVVLQAGEDPALDAEWVAAVIRRIKQLRPIAITLSLGERTDEELALWRKAGADRYLLRFETSNPHLYSLYHPPRPDGWARNRLEMLAALRELDFEVGSGVMIGLPGQTWEDLARDLLLFAELDLDMIGCGPYIRHPHTPIGDYSIAEREGFVTNLRHIQNSDATWGQPQGTPVSAPSPGKRGAGEAGIAPSEIAPVNFSTEGGEVQGVVGKGNSFALEFSSNNGGLTDDGPGRSRAGRGTHLATRLKTEWHGPKCSPPYQEDDNLGELGKLENKQIPLPFSPRYQFLPWAWPPRAPTDQVPADDLTTYKVIALSRILCPWANIPATTALATINPSEGRKVALQRGANVIMPNFTPTTYRKLYEIYPNKAAKFLSGKETLAAVLQTIQEACRVPGTGVGTSPNYLRRKGIPLS